MNDLLLVHKRFASILLRDCCDTGITTVERTQLFDALVALSESAVSGSSCLYIANETSTLIKKIAHYLPWLTLNNANPDKNSVVLLDQSHLYLNKYYYAERDIEEGLKALAEKQDPIDDHFILNKVSALDYMTDAGKKVILNTLKQNLSVITGGPGTGKTTIVVRVLALLIEHYSKQGKDNVRIEILAPTGKASARVKESIVKQKKQWLADLRGFNVNDIQAIPEVSHTVQKFLGINPITRKSRYIKGKKANVDIVIVDEASMLDVMLVRALLAAIRPTTRLILLGDPFQLASVEAGNVLAQIVASSNMQGNEWLQRSCTELTESHRFKSDSAIGQLASATNKGDTQAVLALLNDKDLNDVEIGCVDDSHEAAVKGYQVYKEVVLAARKHVQQEDINKALMDSIFSSFEAWQVFSPFRTGKYGVDGLNTKIEASLGLANDDEWYFGKPVIVTANDHSLKLYNGDIGICLDTEGKTVCFPDADISENEDSLGYRFIKTRILPDHQRVYAMTVHKSQGSEYKRCLLVVPEPNDNQKNLLTREILYTAITRAEEGFYLFAGESEVSLMVETKTERMSGLLRGG